jgi:hypothetical protein
MTMGRSAYRFGATQSSGHETTVLKLVRYSEVCQWDNSLANISEVIGNPLANYLKGVRRYWQPSGKFFEGCQKVLATLWQIFKGCQKVLASV